jgi:diguanylate cyclase (GGDEF)-like protein
MALIGYFFYVDRNLLVRVYIQNFGYGLVLLAAALRLGATPHKKRVDRILFWVLLVFALHFFPRTLLTIGVSPPIGERPFANSVFWQTLQLSIAVLGVSLALAIFAAAFADLLDDARRERNTDPLTGTLNRRGFDEAATAKLTNLEGPASLILCDVDYFKRINDVHGHDIGDAVLKKLGQILLDSVGNNDLVGRFGGEEFLVFLSAADLQGAKMCAESLRTALEGHRFPHLTGNEMVTASFGVVELRPGEPWESLFRRADTCLYAAKNTGRNRTVTA